MKAIVRDVQTWSVFSDRKGYAVNDCAVSTEDGTVLVDPPDPGEDGWLTVDLLEPFAACGSRTATTAGRRPPFASATGLRCGQRSADRRRPGDRVPAGELSTYPGEVIDDRAELLRSAARPLDYDFDALLLCDGQPLPSGGKDKLREFVARSGR